MVEKRFQELRKTLSAEEFNSIEFLISKADELKATDAKLSARVMLRVKNLSKEGELSPQKNITQVAEKKPLHWLTVINTFIEKHKHLNAIKIFCTNTFRNISPFVGVVVLPTLLFSFYQIFVATERFESQAKVIIQQPDSMSTMDPGMALLSGLGVPSGGSDAELVKAYIYSTDMIKYLNAELGLKAHYSQGFIDYFSKINPSDSREDLYVFYQDHIETIVDDKSGVITIKAQGFDSTYAQSLANAVVERAEWFINSIGHQLANAQLDFVQGEHKLIEEKLADAQKKLLLFQQEYNLLDPTAEGMAKQQITYTIESQIAVKQTEIKTLAAIMSKDSAQLKGLENELAALKAQLHNERIKLSQSGKEDISVSEIMSKFTDYKVKMELALQAYTSSQISLEKSRIEAYRQMKYLIVVEEATLSEDSKYPDVVYNISLFILLLSMMFGIGRIIVSTIKELK